MSFKRIRDDVGFAPEWTVEGGVRQVVEAIRSGKVTDLQDPRYSNVKFLTTGGMEQFDKRVYGDGVGCVGGEHPGGGNRVSPDCKGRAQALWSNIM